jgi:hypothetical protein
MAVAPSSNTREHALSLSSVLFFLSLTLFHAYLRPQLLLLLLRLLLLAATKTPATVATKYATQGHSAPPTATHSGWTV